MHLSSQQPERRQKSLSLSKHRTAPSSKPRMYQIDTCPEVSDFRFDTECIYTHTLDIDYGKLSKPYSLMKSQTNHDLAKQAAKPKSTCYRNVVIHESAGKENANTNTETYIMNYEVKSSRCARTENQLKTSGKKNGGLKDGKESLRQEMIEKRSGKSVKNPRKNVVMKLSTVRAFQDCSDKKKFSSRIVKMMVAGGKIETKVISYPDTSQYMKLCNLGGRK